MTNDTSGRAQGPPRPGNKLQTTFRNSTRSPEVRFSDHERLPVSLRGIDRHGPKNYNAKIANRFLDSQAYSSFGLLAQLNRFIDFTESKRVYPVPLDQGILPALDLRVVKCLNDTTRLTSFVGLSFQRASAIENLEGCSSSTDPWLPHAAGCTFKAPEVVKECSTPSKPTMLKEEQTVHPGHIRVYPGHSGPSWSIHSGPSRSFRSILVTFGSIPVIQVHPGPYIRVHPGHSDPSWSHLGLSRSFRSTLITFRSNLVSFSSFRSFRSFRSKFRSLRSSRSFGLIRPNFQSFGSTRSKFRSFGSVRSKFRSFGSFRSKSRSLRIHSVKIPVIRVYPGSCISVRLVHSGLSWFMHSGPSRSFRSILVHAFGSVSFIQVYPGSCIRVRLVHSGLSWFMHSGLSRSFRSILIHAFGSVPVTFRSILIHRHSGPSRP
ncbi:hypothetical protein CRG98_012358 [Punica granatum]|uniref:Uncharacterized protein n=1 Tax=Punica granatum TaxID=22663 RepID=A0A2I0KFI6_PUNGR|nr:hypothetical protein CRG98_012358 [Punica granatum]